MKIPETSANIGAYYGNEENGQWQPNGVIIDNGVGGGVVGSGDAGVHRPPVYPVHIPRGHIPGYVMAGAYYPPAAYPPVPPAPQDDFADYMWMENEEEFDKQVMQQLEEEALMEQCIEAMLEDEQRERHRPVSNGHNNQHYPTSSNGQGSISLEEAVSRSTLNPLAAEFVPTRARPPATEEKQISEEKVKEEAQSTVTQGEIAPKADTEQSKEVTEKSKTEEPTPVPSETPEVSALGAQPLGEGKPRDPKRESKKGARQEPKGRARPLPARSDPGRKEHTPTNRPEARGDETPTAQVAKHIPPPVPEESREGPKPVNYAAAARAPKPRRSPTAGGSTGASGPEGAKAPQNDKPPAVQRRREAK